ncbi:4a-hydroxytetrahydrobiopterin dehydratase [Thermobifida fusca]|jgi:4a-hydroxytetrahydrobiopterin dehydratase|uniref:Putative pterin-4-alpha-carbinolamine dehydratase n=2 Tax=Thermobifida fusca TaxID=2021 RepID=A0A9P2TAN9_THEFU|nr:MULTISPECIES: 4a-hydroxytetrahydrobiopterin dehydratase [Thermobifida]AAZ55583.1 pterin-4-alpha-carbinolamine dehydratase [Thermobifida fusca YX]EOR71428.1 pterin-4-alpha-carbinolamine dehydratase [Thermobifida fusca TM51]MBO2528426.1 4a-hydroxytetrahydrobiopterin dehydratase [Thermobifida sp.]MDD6792739.1 4a-hydroxytetrahydrobiopterin dehydratase [Thermobifida fusca]PZN64364.1 MAG: 4a-hydroxytetrahydrobiopterin dehydratase [Thermobifida fusca]
MVDTKNEAALESAMHRLPAWRREGQAITRTVTVPSFLDGIELVNRVAQAAEEAQHHPDIDIRYTTLTFTLTSHDVGHVTERDLKMAARIDTLVD